MRRQEIFARDLRSSVVAPPRALGRCRGSFFGVGLVGEEISRALPVDVLTLVFGQEMVRRVLDLEQSRILVADTNAVLARWPAGEVDRRAETTVLLLRSLVEALGYPVFVERASAFERRHRLRPSIVHPDGPYLERQLEHVWLMQRQDITFKVGWAHSYYRYDERAHDAAYREQRGARPLASAYVVGGRRLDDRAPNASPYVCTDPQRRVIFARGERVAAKLRAADERVPRAARGYRRLLGKLARAYAALGGEVDGPPEAVIQAIVDRTLERSLRA